MALSIGGGGGGRADTELLGSHLATKGTSGLFTADIGLEVALAVTNRRDFVRVHMVRQNLKRLVSHDSLFAIVWS